MLKRFFFIFFLFSFVMVAQAQETILVFGKDVRLSRPASNSKSSLPDTLHFEFKNEVEVQPDHILLKGYLINTAKSETKITVFPANSSDPFFASIKPNNHLKIRPDFFMPPDVPPPLGQITLPPKSKTLFTAYVDLTRYTYTGTPKILIEWVFLYAEGIRPRGEIEVTLPAHKK